MHFSHNRISMIHTLGSITKYQIFNKLCYNNYCLVNLKTRNACNAKLLTRAMQVKWFFQNTC